MGYLDHIRHCNAHDLARYRPFLADGQRLGWIKREVATRLAAFPETFRVADDHVVLSDQLRSPADRTRAVEDVLVRLCGEPFLPKLRGEHYAVATQWGAPPVLTIDRGAVALFGVKAYGIHVNGIVRDACGLKLWIGRRAIDKPVAPGKLDNLVAGGQPAGLTLAENLAKECAEEADIDAALAARAVPVGAVTYCMESAQGLKPDTLFVYDLDVPADFLPRNTDGEIDDFVLMDVADVAEKVRTTDDFKFNVNLVVIDFLIRHGLIGPDTNADYMALVTGLHPQL